MGPLLPRSPPPQATFRQEQPEQRQWFYIHSGQFYVSKCLQTLGKVSQAKFPKDNTSTLHLFKQAIPDKREVASLLQKPRMQDRLEAMLWEVGANSTEFLSLLPLFLQRLDLPYGECEIRELVGFVFVFLFVLSISQIRKLGQEKVQFPILQVGWI